MKLLCGALSALGVMVLLGEGWEGHLRHREHGVRHKIGAKGFHGSLLELGRAQEVHQPLRGDGLLGQRNRVVHRVVLDLPAVRLTVEEGAQHASGAPAPLQVAANQGAEVVGVVELFLGTMCKGAPRSQRAPLGVGQARLLLVPVGAKLMTIPKRRRTAHILIRVGIHASLPVVLRTHRAPHGLELLCEEFNSERLWLRSLLLRGEQRSRHLIPGVRERAARAMTAAGHCRVSRAEPLLLHQTFVLGVASFQPLAIASAPPLCVQPIH
mmetsp:Transcript_126312/g.299888  ORF Transcript_126312/g.299888 Transcript_126312/m.299888 type:complete len:268 (+) Transcript_126312:448-1251(+)